MASKYRLNGEPPRCLWCGAAGRSEYRETTFTEATKRAQPESVLVCGEQCEEALQRTEQSLAGKLPVFAWGIVLGSVLALAGSFLQALDPRLLHLLAAGTALLGLTILRFPFVTPQTVEMMGMRNGLRLGRLLGLALVLTGLGIAAWVQWGADQS